MENKVQSPGQQPPRNLVGQIRRVAGSVIREIKHFFGVESFLPDEDRRVLEKLIFPYFLMDKSYKSVLFVGVDWYTRGYNKLFEKDRRYITIDVDPSKRKYGANEHIVDAVQNLGKHLSSCSVDLVLMNGVFGWGLNAKADVEQAFLACLYVLRPNGILVIGWNDIAERCPFLLDDCQSLQRFKPFRFPPLKTTVYSMGNRHVYNFYEKP